MKLLLYLVQLATSTTTTSTESTSNRCSTQAIASMPLAEIIIAESSPQFLVEEVPVASAILLRDAESQLPAMSFSRGDEDRGIDPDLLSNELEELVRILCCGIKDNFSRKLLFLSVLFNVMAIVGCAGSNQVVTVTGMGLAGLMYLLVLFRRSTRAQAEAWMRSLHPQTRTEQTWL